MITTNSFIGLSLLEISYLISAALFISGLRMLSHPDKARKGNLLAAIGMTLAIITTLLFHKTNGQGIKNLEWILAAIAIGSALGWIIAMRVAMTAMPQLVSFFNGMGGAAAALISLMEFPHILENSEIQSFMRGDVLAIVLGLVIGSVSFSGSMIAFGKLAGKIGDIRGKGIWFFNLGMLLITAFLAIYLLLFVEQSTGYAMSVFVIILALSLLYGVSFVMPIGGADMPVVISLLNSFTGVAAAMGGFLYNNNVMLTGGILVGSAGAILTVLMCKAMNRSLFNVIIGAFGGAGKLSVEEGGNIKEISFTDTAVLLNYSQRVFIVPGYGLAVAQAQQAVKELVKLLEGNGVEVKFAIHPVAGRMPGHMNVLLAEADISYDKLIESDHANSDMPSTDVVLVIGANDVVNPAAEDDPGSPIYGMPIVKVRDAKNIIFMKRGMGKGYAAIENPLFFHDKTRMLFGDAKQSLQKIIEQVKSL